MAGKNKRHTHKYHRINIAGDMLWACALPDCYHYMPRHMNNMVIGKKSICWSCNNDLVMDTRSMQSNMPQCLDCETGTTAESREMDELLNKR